MDRALFEECIQALDRKCFNKKSKVVLITDNCLAHPTIGNLSNVRLIFLLPNTKYASQPMDQGVIKRLTHFTSMFVQCSRSSDLWELRQCHADLVPEELNAKVVAHINSNIITTEVQMADEQILASATFEGEDKEEENVIKIFDNLAVKPSSIDITYALNTLQNLRLFHEVENDMLELLQRFKSLHVVARKQSRILSYLNRK